MGEGDGRRGDEKEDTQRKKRDSSREEGIKKGGIQVDHDKKDEKG